MGDDTSRHNNIERIGVYKVASLITEDFGWIFRELSIVDVGIDAYIEEVIDGRPTGKIIALQIKSGESHFYKSKNDNSISFYFNKTHYDYWMNYSLPVLLVGYFPDEQKVRWQIIRKENVSKTGKRFKLILNKLLSREFKHEIKAFFKPLFTYTLNENIKVEVENNTWINELILQINDGYTNSNYIYPLLKSKDEYIENAINFQVRDSFFNLINTEPNISRHDEILEMLSILKKSYLEKFNGGISNINYKIYQNQFNIFSLSIMFIYIGAYSSYVSTHLCFDLKTGNRIDINQLIKPFKIPYLKEKLSNMKLERFLTSLDDLKNQHPDITYFNNDKFDNSIFYNVEKQDLNSFIVTDNSIQFVLEYGFPHVIKAYEPNPLFIINRDELKEIANPKGKFKN